MPNTNLFRKTKALCRNDKKYNKSFDFMLSLQRTPMPEEYYSHKFIFNLHFMDLFMDSYTYFAGEYLALSTFAKRFLPFYSLYGGFMSHAVGLPVFISSGQFVNYITLRKLYEAF